MNILIDIGNTACKVASVHGKEIGKMYRYAGDDITGFILDVLKKETPQAKPSVIVLSSVRNKDSEMEKILEKECGRLIVFDTDYLFEVLKKKHGIAELEVMEKMPQGMGSDRMAAILAAHTLLPDKDLIIFDFGTATTVEFVNGRREDSCGTSLKPEYLGGAISLGLNTRYKALHHFTRKIPLLNPNDFLASHNISNISTIGYDLDTAMAAGNILGIMFEIQGYMAEYPDRTVVLTGGDAVYFAEKLKKEVVVVYNLVLMGLAQIAQYNA